MALALDEIAGETEQLLDSVKLLKEAPKIKVCASSRPKQVFKRLFNDLLQIRVQDINQWDIEQTAKGQLLARLHETFPGKGEEVDRLIWAVSHHSEAVFLWTELVINSVKEGLENGDMLEMLESRLRILPHAWRRKWVVLERGCNLFWSTSTG